MDHKTMANLLLHVGKGLFLVLLPVIIPFFLSEPVRRYYGYFLDIHHNVDRLFLLTNLLEGKMMCLPIGNKPLAEAWANSMKALRQEVADFTKDYESWKHENFFPRIWLRLGIASRAGLLLEKAELLEKVNVDAEGQMPLLVVEEHNSISTVYGQEPLLKDALCYLQDPGPRVIGIYGVGGIGKTTLLSNINEYFAGMPDQASSNNVDSQATRDCRFHHVVWATVSREANVEKLQGEVARRLGLSLPHGLCLQERAEVICNYMKDRNFLLLLDDIWVPLELKELGIPNPQEGGSQLWRKVVFTTRLEKVCDSMQAMDIKKARIKVGFLSKGKAWQLFRRMLGEKFNDSDREIENLAKDIAKQCCGLPLALKVIGAAMSSKKSLDDWEDALELLKESQPISGTKEDIFCILKHSYDYLNDDMMKNCFLSCALWPEDYDIDKNELIQCWIGLGLLDRYNKINEKYRVGREYIQDLKAACLLEAGFYEDQKVKMHDVIRDMALQIVFDKHNWMVRAGVGLEEAPRDSEKWAASERVSLMMNGIINLPIFEKDEAYVEGALMFPKLSTLMLQYNLLTKIPSCFFPCMLNLTYLDLSNNDNLEELPREICDLTGLQYLNLSWTGIRSLPHELGRLKNLRYLFLTYLSLKSEVTPELLPRSLQVLDFYGSSVHWEAKGEEILGGLKKLEFLGITVRSTRMLQMLSKLSHVHLRSIAIMYIDSPASIVVNWILGDFRRIRNQLRQLLICALSNLKELKVDFGEEGNHVMAWNLRKLQLLHLHSLSELDKIVFRGVEAKDFLPRLRDVWISKCHKLENVPWVLQLPHLEFLSVISCQGMKTLIDDITIGEGIADLAFPRLKYLELRDLPNLEGIYSKGLAFPSLQIIEVRDCPKLGGLPFRWPLTHNKVRLILGSQEWWDGLLWEDERIGNFLKSHFHVSPDLDD